MIKFPELTGKKVAILGAAREGLAVAEFLLSQGIRPTIADQKPRPELPPTELDVDWRNGRHYLDDLDTFDVLFRSPGLPWLHPKLAAARRAGVIVSSRTRLFFELSPAPIIGITGTK